MIGKTTNATPTESLKYREVLREADRLLKLRADPREWIESNLQIRTKDRRVVPFRFNAVQADYYLRRTSRDLILKPRQLGFTTLICGLFFADAVLRPHTTSTIASDDSDSSQKIFGIVRFFWEHLTEEQKRRIGKPQILNRQEMYWPGLNSRFYVGTAGSLTFGRGQTINNLLCTEFAFWPKPEEALRALSQAVPADSMIVVESTPNGVGNFFHDLWVQAKQGENRYRPPCCPKTHLAPGVLVQPLSWYSSPSCIPLRGEASRMEEAERGPDWAGLPVIATVARLLCRELTLQNEYLRLENRILKEKVSGRIQFTDEERRSLAEAALAMGRSLMKEVVSIVKPETILAWQRRLERSKWDYSERRRRGPGRPRTPDDIAALVCRLARENLWGYQRLRGELLKLRITLSKGCIADILRRNGLPPSPQRAGLTWQQFLSRHAEVMLCADLFTKEVWTLSGLRTAYVLFVLHLGTRRIVLAEATFSPHGQWMGQMARNLLMDCEDLEITPRFVLHDRDKLLIWHFDAVLTGAEVTVVKTPFRAPDANAHAERWVRSVTEECLDHLILVGMNSLQRALRVYRDFFNAHRPHQGIGNRIPERRTTGEMSRNYAEAMPDEDLAVECEQFLGGLLNSYYRKAA